VQVHHPGRLDLPGVAVALCLEQVPRHFFHEVQVTDNGQLEGAVCLDARLCRFPQGGHVDAAGMA
jgi:hypothetical protein